MMADSALPCKNPAPISNQLNHCVYTAKKLYWTNYAQVVIIIDRGRRLLRRNTFSSRRFLFSIVDTAVLEVAPDVTYATFHNMRPWRNGRRGGFRSHST